MQLVWFFLVMVAAAGADSSESPRTFCGRTLADARMLYCMIAEGSKQQKRGGNTDLHKESLLYQEKRGILPDDIDDAIWPILPLHGWSTQALQSRRSKRMTGLVDECCLKPCYLSELLSYC